MDILDILPFPYFNHSQISAVAMQSEGIRKLSDLEYCILNFEWISIINDEFEDFEETFISVGFSETMTPILAVFGIIDTTIFTLAARKPTIIELMELF